MNNMMIPADTNRTYSIPTHTCRMRADGEKTNSHKLSLLHDVSTIRSCLIFQIYLPIYFDFLGHRMKLLISSHMDSERWAMQVLI